MNIARKDIILHTIQNHNILPITSACNTNCIFCSHKFNSQDLNVYKLPQISIEDIEVMVSFLNPGRKIIIGESATRIVEGEPFLRRDILDILRIIRKSFKKETIEITTNGTGLTEEKIKILKEFEPIELNISLNSASEPGRQLLQGDRNPKRAIEGVKLLSKYNICFHGSIVAMPMEVGYKDIYETILFLDNNNCKTIRLLTPGFAKGSVIKFNFFELRKELDKFISKIQQEVGATILLEPPIITNLKPVVEGIIEGGIAHNSGIRAGDIIYKVNDYEPKTRVDCFNYIFRSKNPTLKIKRLCSGNIDNIEIYMTKGKNTSPEFVMLYDISSDTREEILEVIRRNRAKNPIVLTSEIGIDVMEKLLDEEIKSGMLSVKVVKNTYFGGSIKSAGLLLVEDFIKEINEIKENNVPDLIIISSKPFDYLEKDLKGNSLYDIEDKTKIKVEAI
ncbi:MAG: DUF512 domain-containing protein [Firmicutes bacterium]|nr:DUF512 domain-containing protein [Bacillota bacterium]